MKNIDTDLRYDLSSLTDAQLLQFAKEANKFKKNFQESFCDLDWLKEYKNDNLFIFSGKNPRFEYFHNSVKSVDARTLFIESNKCFTFIKEVLETFEEKLYRYTREYSQFTIDYIQNNIVDLDYTLLSGEDFLSEMIYDVGNILKVIKDGADKDLFIELKLALEDENNRSN